VLLLLHWNLYKRRTISRVWCVDFHRYGVFIGVQGGVTDLVKSVTRQVVLGRQSPLIETIFLYLAAKLLLRVSSPTPVHTLLLLGKGTESLNRLRSCLITRCGAVQDLDCSLPRGETPRTFCFSVEGLSPRWTELIEKGGASAAMVTMIMMHVLVDKLLCQDSRGWSLVFENLPARSVCIYGYTQSGLALNGIAPQKPSATAHTRYRKAPGCEAGSAWPVVGFCLFYNHWGKPGIVCS
jgi:hypothetical protein